MTLATTLERIQNRARLNRRDRHPLWAYKVTAEELGELRAGLVHAFARGDFSTATAAAFCMFAANDFCRTHEGGTWSWTSILEHTGWTHGVGARLYDLVERGLLYWGIGTVLATDRRHYYQRTLACQGGLPLKLLARSSGSHLQHYFRRLLRQAELYALPPEELAATAASGLPRTLQNEIVYAVAAELVAAIMTLRQSPAVRAADPVGEFDRTDPSWRTRVPLHLEDKVALELLRGLLKEPTDAERSMNAIVELVLALRFDGSPRLVRNARVADAADEAALKKLFQPAHELPPYFFLSLLFPDGTRRPLATAHRVQSADVYRITPEVPAKPIRRGPGLLGAVRVIASIGEQDIGQPAEVSGGQPIPSELPWVLRGSQITEELSVRSFGSARVAGDKMLLLLPYVGDLDLEEGAELETLTSRSPESRRLVALSGSASFRTDDGDVCRFATRSQEDEAGYLLTGVLRRFAFAGSETWLGAPHVMRTIDGQSRQVPAEKLQWRPRGSLDWRPWTDRAIGDVFIRVRENGETVYRTSATIVPRDLELNIAASVQGRGVISLKHRELQQVRVSETNVASATSAARGSGCFEVTVRTGHQLTATLALSLLFSQNREAVLQVPCPIDLRMFVGFDGEPLTSEDVRALDRLGSVRALAVQATPTRLVLEARLMGQRAWRAIAELEGRAEDGVAELSLDRVQSAVATLMAGSWHLDATAQLRVVPKTGALTGAGQAPILNVRRYDTWLVPDRDLDHRVETVRLDSGSMELLGDQGARLLRVDVRPLDQPDAEPIALPELEPGCWKFPWAELTPGPWLVLGWQGEWARLRPLLIFRSGDTAEGLDELQRAMRVDGEAARRAAISDLLERIEGDYGAPEWVRIHSMAETLGVLPAMTFDVIRAIAARPLSAAMLAIRTAASGAIWNGLEELGFLWAAIPVRVWVQAVQRVRAYVGSQDALARVFGSANAASEHALQAFWTAAPRRARFMSTVLELIGRIMPGVPSTDSQNPMLALALSNGDALLQMPLEQERDRVIRRNAERRWPRPDLSGFFEPDVWVLVRETAPIHARIPYHEPLFNGPVALAATAMLDRPLSEAALFELRLLRDFDPDWFELAHAFSLTRLLARHLTETPEAFDDIR